MKIFKFLIAFFALTILVIGCKKKDNTPSNYFSFKGKTYEITDALLGKLVFTNPKDKAREYDVHQMIFLSVSGKDSTKLWMAVGDTATNVLGGNYPSNSIYSYSRGIISQDSLAGSILELSTKEIYFSGLGGSTDISLSGNTNTITFNNISAGVYTYLSVGGKLQYNEIGTISGKYTGPLLSVTFASLKNGQNNFIEQAKESTYH